MTIFASPTIHTRFPFLWSFRSSSFSIALKHWIYHFISSFISQRIKNFTILNKKKEEQKWPPKQWQLFRPEITVLLLRNPKYLSSLFYFIFILAAAGGRPWWSSGQELPLSQSSAAWGCHCPCQCSVERNAMMPTYRSPTGPECSSPTSTPAFHHNFTSNARG